MYRKRQEKGNFFKKIQAHFLVIKIYKGNAPKMGHFFINFQAKVNYEIIWSRDEEILNVLGKCKADSYYEHDKESLIGEVLDFLDVKPNKTEGVKEKGFSLKFNSDKDIVREIRSPKEDGEAAFVSVRAIIKNMPNVAEDMVIFYDNYEVDK